MYIIMLNSICERVILMKRIFLTIQGIVQGVGFRPFVYNLASKLNLKGWVNNNSEGVYIDLEGNEAALDIFIDELHNYPPPLAKIDSILIEDKPKIGYDLFSIKESEIKEERITLISPDIATCQDCINDIRDLHNRRYKYPFTNCTNCGPRFSIIKSIPYDRDKTTMNKFKMCNECHDEYTNPSNRRFHAQPNACSHCGPEIWITDKDGHNIDTGSIDAIEWTKVKLQQGSIFAIKGLGGFHLVCDAKNAQAVKTLRERKHRPFKPFAVMAKDIETILKYCPVNDKEKAILTGIRKPIVLLKRNLAYDLPYEVAPNQNTLGVMLPYTPLHELLLANGSDILVMTSANVNGLPLEYSNESALNNLKDIVDYFLLHNRDIYIPVDDSVVKVVDNDEIMIRRARGYVPAPLRTHGIKNILACGSNMKNTFSIAKEDFLFISQHNGDLENLETIEHYKKNIDHFKNIFSFTPQYIACDMHPGYASTDYANTYNLPIVNVQHHHAHIASCMFENNIKEKIIGVSFDGTGYGTDGKIWGGEFLICDYSNFKRAAQLQYVNMPGGDKAIMEPWRLAVTYILKYENLIPDWEKLVEKFYGFKGISLASIINKNINCIETSSMGRLFDAAASIAGVRNSITYEGQASIEFEALIDEKVLDYYQYDTEVKDGIIIINPGKTLTGLISDRLTGIPAATMATKFHNSVINFSVDVLLRLRSISNLNKVALSGGVFQNTYLLKNLCKRLKEECFHVYIQKSIPSNDGGISLGQIVIANEKLNNF